MKRNQFILTILAMGVALLLTGCFEEAKFTGGGSLDSAAGEATRKKANFGFVMDGCGCNTVFEAVGKFNYHDMAVEGFGKNGVKMKGDLHEVLSSDGGSGSALVNYRSTNPKNKGEGWAEICFTDLGEGNTDHGYLTIYVIDGPFAGYYNQGIIKGNIQYHECD